DHHRERAVAATREHRAVTARDDRARNLARVLQPAGDEQIAAEQDLVERGDDLLRHAACVAVDHHGDAFARRRQRGTLAARGLHPVFVYHGPPTGPAIWRLTGPILGLTIC